MKRSKRTRTTILAALALGGLSWMGTGGAQERFELSEAELDAVTAGTAADADARQPLTFEVVRRTRSGRTVTADGSVELLRSPYRIAPLGTLSLDRAQNNLQSVININAVNSAVNVLLNLNVNIDSRVDTLSQTNLNGVRSPAPR